MSELVHDHLGTTIHGVERVTGGTKKGVYRLTLEDGPTVLLYVWAADENYWPATHQVPDDPFTDASGAGLFEAAHRALTKAKVRVPRLIALDRRSGSDVALVEDAGTRTLEHIIDQDPNAPQLESLGAALRRMHTTRNTRYGKIADETADQRRRPEDIVVDRAMNHLQQVVPQDKRLYEARERITQYLKNLRREIQPRKEYGLVHGELGPDHVLVNAEGEAVVIDIEGCTWFDVEWDHAWLRMRFGDAYPALNPVELDNARLELYEYAQTLSLIEGPLRIAKTDYPRAQWMRDLAEWNIAKVLRSVEQG